MESFPVALNIKLTNLPLPRRTRQGEVLLLLLGILKKRT